MKCIIYIDDTGTPSFKSLSKYDSGDWHSHVAIFIEEKLFEPLLSKISTIFEKFKIFNDFEEFHFIHILSGKKGWRDVSLTIRLEIFREFAALYAQFKFPILIQSFTSDDIIRNQMVDFTKLKFPNFDLSKLPDLTMFFLFIRIKEFVKKEKCEFPVDIKIDSGKGKHMGKITVPIFKDITVNANVEFLDSKKDRVIQFADFVSFSLNRMRWIYMNSSKSLIDIELLKIFNVADFEVVNLKKVFVDPYDIKSDDYDQILRKQYDKNGNLSDEEVDRIKHEKKN